MSRWRWVTRVAIAGALWAIGAAPAIALPSMIRLGYTNCAACHLSPQGGGLLNDYGRGIDESQSLRAGEYRPGERPLQKALTLNGRITQDARLVLQKQLQRVDGRPDTSVFRPRLSYRNATQLGKGLRLSATVTGETESVGRPARDYDPAARSGQVFVNSALLNYRVGNSLEFAAGRDQLPTGVNVPDLTTFVRARNRLGYYDVPTQVKMSWWGGRHQVSTFAYGPGGNEPSGERESGGGTLAEFDVLGKQRTVVGVTVLGGTAGNGGRRVVGGYARLGFGSWGVLVEHDVTHRSREEPVVTTLRQDATYTQVFWAIREWLVVSAIGERLSVQSPFDERLSAARLELSARLASQATVSLGTRVEREMRTGRLGRSLIFQAAFKTVN